MPGRKIKIIIDTNLFISFLISKSKRILESLLLNEDYSLVFSEQNILEVSNRNTFKNLHY